MSTATANVSDFVQYADGIMQLRYSHVVCNRKETWSEIAQRVVRCVVDPFVVTKQVGKEERDGIFEMIQQRLFIPGGRILAHAGHTYHQTDNCFTLKAEDTREGWAELAHKCTVMFMSGGGVGVEYGAIRPYGQPLKRSGGIASGPLPLIDLVNSIAAAARQGGERRGACYASLPWNHPDIYNFISMKDHGGLQHTNISVRFDNQFIAAIHNKHDQAVNVWNETVHHACKYGDPGFQFDDDGQILRNACTEIISADDSDSCCLGSVNFAKIKDVGQLYDVASLGILFLLCNTIYTEKPTRKVEFVKVKNRRLGLGIMGIGEWFIQRDMPYGMSAQIEQWLTVWKEACEEKAIQWSGQLDVNIPIATRAIAPTGTISIVGGHTTSGIEPIFDLAHKRTYNTLKTQVYDHGFQEEIVVEPVVQKWLEEGRDVSQIETAYSLSQSPEGIERRIAFQAFCQQYVDNAISSTVNLPSYVQGIEEQVGGVLLKYLPALRGITFYPDGRHSYQPLQPVDITQLQHRYTLYNTPICQGDSCGN